MFETDSVLTGHALQALANKVSVVVAWCNNREIHGN